MRQDLDDLLCQRYPELFRNRHQSIYKTAMCWGFCCGDGWFDIIDNLCAVITTQVKAGKMPPVFASQVKEKFGTLRFHFRGGNDETRRLIKLATQKSECTCEECGRSIELSATHGCRVLCPACSSRDQSKSAVQFDSL